MTDILHLKHDLSKKDILPKIQMENRYLGKSLDKIRRIMKKKKKQHT